MISRMNGCVLALALLLAGCGSSSSSPAVADGLDGGDESAKTMVLTADRSLTGWFRSDGLFGTPGGTGGIVLVGDTGIWGLRGFLGFNIGGIPADAEILAAELSVWHFKGPAQGSPYADLGNLLIDYVDIGSSLDLDDYRVLALESDIAVLSDAPTEGLRTADVTKQLQTARVLADLAAGRPVISFRVRFPKETDGDVTQTDAVNLNGLDDPRSNGVLPTLTVEYREP